MELAHKVGAEHVLNASDPDIEQQIEKIVPGGVDATLEMSGHPSQLSLAINATRPGGRISLLGIYPQSMQTVDINKLIFKGIEMQGIVGRRLWETWDQMAELLKSGKLNLDPVITQRCTTPNSKRRWN